MNIHDSLSDSPNTPHDRFSIGYMIYTNPFPTTIHSLSLKAFFYKSQCWQVVKCVIFVLAEEGNVTNLKLNSLLYFVLCCFVCCIHQFIEGKRKPPTQCHLLQSPLPDHFRLLPVNLNWQFLYRRWNFCKSIKNLLQKWDLLITPCYLVGLQWPLKDINVPMELHICGQKFHLWCRMHAAKPVRRHVWVVGEMIWRCRSTPICLR